MTNFGKAGFHKKVVAIGDDSWSSWILRGAASLVQGEEPRLPKYAIPLDPDKTPVCSPEGWVQASTTCGGAAFSLASCNILGALSRSLSYFGYKDTANKMTQAGTGVMLVLSPATTALGLAVSRLVAAGMSYLEIKEQLLAASVTLDEKSGMPLPLEKQTYPYRVINAMCQTGVLEQLVTSAAISAAYAASDVTHTGDVDARYREQLGLQSPGAYVRGAVHAVHQWVAEQLGSEHGGVVSEQPRIGESGHHRRDAESTYPIRRGEIFPPFVGGTYGAQAWLPDSLISRALEDGGLLNMEVKVDDYKNYLTQHAAGRTVDFTGLDDGAMMTGQQVKDNLAAFFSEANTSCSDPIEQDLNRAVLGVMKALAPSAVSRVVGNYSSPAQLVNPLTRPGVLTAVVEHTDVFQRIATLENAYYARQIGFTPMTMHDTYILNFLGLEPAAEGTVFEITAGQAQAYENYLADQLRSILPVEGGVTVESLLATSSATPNVCPAESFPEVPLPKADGSNSSASTPVIAGSVVGSLAAAAAVVGVVFAVRRGYQTCSSTRIVSALPTVAFHNPGDGEEGSVASGSDAGFAGRAGRSIR